MLSNLQCLTYVCVFIIVFMICCLSLCVLCVCFICFMCCLCVIVFYVVVMLLCFYIPTVSRGDSVRDEHPHLPIESDSHDRSRVPLSTLWQGPVASLIAPHDFMPQVSRRPCRQMTGAFAFSFKGRAAKDWSLIVTICRRSARAFLGA